jgi:hypothetical protein
MRTRVWLFAIICLLAAAVVGAAVARALFAQRVGRNAAPTPDAARVLPAPPDRPFVMFVNLTPNAGWKRIALAPLASPDGPRYTGRMVCERVYFAGSRGVCLFAKDTLFPAYYARIFDERFEALSEIRLTGPPSRARVSPDGRRAAITVFEQGHSYAETGFSTRTTLVDTMSGASLGDLEQFVVWRDGRRFQARDFNFWGVTFARDGDRFFATLSSGGVPYLIEGHADRREARVLHAGVECPSLSPDNTRVAFKRMIRRESGREWQLWLLDLSTLSERPVAGETRNIDDQVDWLDDTHLVYHFPSTDGNNIWMVGTDEGKPPRRFMREAFSPSVVP